MKNGNSSVWQTLTSGYATCVECVRRICDIVLMGTPSSPGFLGQTVKVLGQVWFPFGVALLAVCLLTQVEQVSEANRDHALKLSPSNYSRSSPTNLAEPLDRSVGKPKARSRPTVALQNMRRVALDAKQASSAEQVRTTRLASLGLLSFMLFLWTRMLMRRIDPGNLAQLPIYAWSGRWLPIMLVFLPQLAYFASMSGSRLDPSLVHDAIERQRVVELNSQLGIEFWNAVKVFGLEVLVGGLLLWIVLHGGKDYAKLRAHGVTVALWISVLIFFYWCFKFAANAATLSVGWDAVGVLLLGMALWIPIICGIKLLSARVHAPLLAIPIMIWAVKGVGNLDARREVEWIATPEFKAIPPARQGQPDGTHPPSPDQMRDLRTAFREWLRGRQDRDPSPFMNPYPVFIVYAQGGGIRATYQTAMTLATLQDTYSGFADHTFAICGVSGGSLGTAIFATVHSALDKSFGAPERLGDPEGKHRYYTQRIFERDLLTPVLGRHLFCDTLGGGLPWDFLSSDRSKALAEGLVESSRQGLDGLSGIEEGAVAMARRLSALYVDDQGKDLFSTGSIPALFLTATSVRDGRPFVASFHRFLPRDGASRANVSGAAIAISSLADVDDRRDISLADAACLSARFPLITSIGILQSAHSGGENTEVLVDGGYFDNSGASTALGILEDLAGVAHEQNAFFVLIRIGDDLRTSQKRAGVPAFEDAFSPFYAAAEVFMGATSSALSRLETTAKGLQYERVLEALRFASQNPKQMPPGGLPGTEIAYGVKPRPYSAQVFTEELVRTTEGIPLPLGWTLSELAQDDIVRQISKAASGPRSEASLKTTSDRNANTIWRIGEFLKGELPRDPSGQGAARSDP